MGNGPRLKRAINLLIVFVEGGITMDDKKYKTPQGTIALLIIFIILMIALWGSAYLTLLQRGVTI